MTARCPRCEGAALIPCDADLVGFDETIRATHECKSCRARFRIVPPEADGWDVPTPTGPRPPGTFDREEIIPNEIAARLRAAAAPGDGTVTIVNVSCPPPDCMKGRRPAADAGGRSSTASLEGA